MGMKAVIARWVAFGVYKKSQKWMNNASFYQERVLKKLISVGIKTRFGRDHNFGSIHSVDDFRKRVPVREYEDFIPYIHHIKQGEADVLWKGSPLYLSTTSGTTSGIKYIPISKESIREQIRAARYALLFYIFHSGKSEFLDGKLIFLSGSPELNHRGKLAEGRLSGIINHHIPGYLKTNQVPSYKTNCIEDWETKVEKIIDETMGKDLRLISGIPPWVQMYFDRIFERTGRSMNEVFPNFSLFVYGGVNFDPYRSQLERRIGKKIDSIETYPASEGFFAFQDRREETGLLLLVNAGIFYEFIPLEELSQPDFSRLSLEEIKLNVNYAIVISTNAGLWGYLVGDTIKFISREPYRILVTGRTKHFISAFGEHVIGEEVESAIGEAAQEFGVSIVEFSVAPQVNPDNGKLPYHEWFIEFGQNPADLQKFAQALNEKMMQKNHYYRDLIEGKILQSLQITPLKENAFIDFMKEKGKLGGQNKVPHLSNHRENARLLENYMQIV